MAFTAILCSLTLARVIGSFAQVLPTLSFFLHVFKRPEKGNFRYGGFYWGKKSFIVSLMHLPNEVNGK